MELSPEETVNKSQKIRGHVYVHMYACKNVRLGASFEKLCEDEVQAPFKLITLIKRYYVKTYITGDVLLVVK